MAERDMAKDESPPIDNEEPLGEAPPKNIVEKDEYWRRRAGYCIIDGKDCEDPHCSSCTVATSFVETLGRKKIDAATLCRGF